MRMKTKVHSISFLCFLALKVEYSLGKRARAMCVTVTGTRAVLNRIFYLRRRLPV